MSESTMWDQFETWARERALSLPVNRSIPYNQYTQLAWDAWQASRMDFSTIVMRPIVEALVQTGVKQVVMYAELLSAAERYLDFRHASDIGMGEDYSGVHPQTELKNAIAKAKGAKL